MRRILWVVARSILNFVMFCLLSISATFGIYNLIPEFYELKNALFPIQGAIILCIILSFCFMLINEAISMFMTRLYNRRERKYAKPIKK